MKYGDITSEKPKRLLDRARESRSLILKILEAPVEAGCLNLGRANALWVTYPYCPDRKGPRGTVRG
jgi:hypothetical protein